MAGTVPRQHTWLEVSGAAARNRSLLIYARRALRDRTSRVLPESGSGGWINWIWSTSQAKEFHLIAGRR